MNLNKHIVLAFIVTLCSMLAYGCRHMAQKPQIIIVAMDGLEPKLVTALLQAHKMPNFQRLLRNGSFAKITCVVGTTSPVVWTTVATGMPPEVHGITGFVENDIPVTSTARRVPAFWNILTKQGFTVATLGWLVTWPAEKDGGIMVTDRAMIRRLKSTMFPPKVIDLDPLRTVPKDFLSKFTSFPFDPNYEQLPKDDPKYAANFLVERRLINIFRHDWTYTNIAVSILKEKNPDILSLYLQGADYVGHGFWKYYEPEPFREEGWKIDETEINYFKDVIPRYYAFLDYLLGRVLERARKNATIILLSDHGFGPGLGPYAVETGSFLSGNHRPLATLILSGPEMRTNVTQTGMITHEDILPTALFALGLPIAQDQYGYPLLDYFSDEFLKQHPIKMVQTYGQPKKGGQVQPSESDEQILDELRSLGYIQ